MSYLAQRICPVCQRETGERSCPHDGFATRVRPTFAVAACDPLVGRIFEGRYRIDSVLGGGGMGRVYRATQLGVAERPVAIKVLHPELASRDVFTQRFQREARTVSQLCHPNTIRMFDFGETDAGELYLVTELLHGCSLQDLLDRHGRLPAARSVHIVSQALKGLAEAHDQGVVHRDVKPDNLFVCKVHGETDFVKLLDFGIAWRPEAESTRLTRTGNLFGTPHFMSPEQIEGAHVEARSDLYSLGVVLYQMLSGRLPFDGPSSMSVMMAHVNQRPPRPPGVPGALCDVVMDCLAKSPDDRPRSAEDMRRRLESALSEVGGADLAEADAIESADGPMDTPAALYLRTAETGEMEAQPQAQAQDGLSVEFERIAPPDAPKPMRVEARDAPAAPNTRKPRVALLGATWAASIAALVVAALPARSPLPALPSLTVPPARAAAPAPPPTPRLPLRPVATREADDLALRRDRRTQELPVLLTASPARAMVYDGERILGRAPVTLYLERGEARTVTLKASSYRSAVVTLDASNAAPPPVRLTADARDPDVDVERFERSRTARAR